MRKAAHQHGMLASGARDSLPVVGRALPATAALPPERLLMLAIGPQGAQQLLGHRLLQARLSVSQPDDPCEQEAERVAGDVMRMPWPSFTAAQAPAVSLSRRCSTPDGASNRSDDRSGAIGLTWPGGDRQGLSRASEAGADAAADQLDDLQVSPAVETGIGLLAGRGGPLPEPVLAFMEPRFKADFRAVRIHTDAHAQDLARAVNAQAFTVGRDVVFGAGRYAPETDSGRHLLAHELTHVIQQSGAHAATDHALDRPPEAGQPVSLQLQAADAAAATPDAGAAPTTDPAVEALDLSAKAKAAAQQLKRAHPGIVLLSGRRTVAEQANAMAQNIVASNNRQWIAKTYLSGAALQKWVDDNPGATSVAQIAAGLESLLEAMTERQRKNISLHTSGDAFDVQPQEDDAAAIKADMRALPGVTQFLEKEGGLERWHVQFRRDPGVSAQRPSKESAMRPAAGATAIGMRGLPRMPVSNVMRQAATSQSQSGGEAFDIGALQLQGVSGDVVGETFHFIVNTGRLRPGEEQRLRIFAGHVPHGAFLDIHGFASEEGPADLNERLSRERAMAARDFLLDAGLPPPRLSKLFYHGATPGLRAERRSVVITTAPPRTPTSAEASALSHLVRLGAKAATETDGADFQLAVLGFKKQLDSDLASVPAGTPLPDDLRIVIEALLLWDVDTGKQWGEGTWDSADFKPTAGDYAVVPASQYKCNAFLAEVVYRAVGVVHRGHQKEGIAPTAPGAWFSYKAMEWGDPAFVIPNFPVVSSPLRGDVLCSGTHVGVYLGRFAGKEIYISARDESSGLLGIGEQFTHGIQIKYTQSAIYRRYVP